MPAANPAPGIRFELADPPRSLPRVRTDVAGLVGFAERGVLHRPVRVESWPQYEAAFGGFGGGGYLPHAVHAFFENGGRTAYVVRVAVPPDDSDVPLERRAHAARAELPLDLPTSGATAGGSTSDGSTSDGSTSDGSTSDGSTSGGSTPNGSAAGGSTSGGSTPDGSVAGGSTSGGSAAGGSTPDGSMSGESTADGSTADGSTSGESAGGGGTGGKTPRLVIEARSPGHWGNGIAVEVAPAGGSSRLTVRVSDGGGMIWRLGDASLDPADPRWLPAVAAATAGLPASIEVDPAIPPRRADETPEKYAERLPTARAAKLRLRGGRDGTAACTRRHLLGGEMEHASRWGLAALREVDDVAMVAVPDCGAFPPRDDVAPPEPEPAPCTVLEIPPDDASRFRLPERDTAWTVDEAAALLGTTPARLRQANPGVGATLPPGSVLRLPVPHAARGDDPRVDDLSAYWRPGAGAGEVKAGLERLAGNHGLTLPELLAANPAYHPALGGDPAWRAPALAVVVPEPAPETPPRWGWDDTLFAADTLIAFCEARRDCVALLDPPAEADTGSAVERFRAALPDTPAAGLYWPWLLAERDPRAAGGAGSGRRGGTIPVPPSGFVAGLTAAADLAVGPHRTPAGQTARRALAAVAAADDEVHGTLNARGVNVFRERPQRGVVLEGTRSLARGGPWRWLNARRVFLAIAEEIEERTAWAVFEPAGPRLWDELRIQVRTALTVRWRRGWLAGGSPEEAFYVRCDAETNTQPDQDAGRVVALVGLRLPPPVEWIEVRIGRSSLGLEILDVSRAA